MSSPERGRSRLTENDYALMVMGAALINREPGERLDSLDSEVEDKMERAAGLLRALQFSDTQIIVAAAKADIDIANSRQEGNQNPEDFNV